MKQIDSDCFPPKISDVISSPIYITDFQKTTNTVRDSSCSRKRIKTAFESTQRPQKTSSSLNRKGKLRIDLPHKDTDMTSAVMQRNGNSGYYVNGHVNIGEQHEMAVDCPPSYVAAHPPNSNFSTPRLETPPPTPYDSQTVQNQKVGTIHI